ncbi:hypothetical protein LMG18090_03149 [Ralstonia mannitolilytica]|uniref:hypothetical protein n=1 Tax=Ralstonia mannitolilytica TaxID=105219 RepID=UPI0028F5F337|nr:hypothetical protein [Ralstonia mannitolilytica]CAJ0794539.1 hypothetical protein LMG18090_03149 [Ralstonia mannitolilytica]
MKPAPRLQGTDTDKQPPALERRAFLNWMSAGAMAAALPALVSCGGGDDNGTGSGGGADAGQGGDATPGSIDPVTRMTALSAVRTQYQSLQAQGMPVLDRLQALSTFMANRPEYALTGVHEETLSAWGIFTDGRVHIIADNRAPDPDEKPEPMALPMFARKAPLAAAAGAAVELPSSENARLLHAFGKDFPGQTTVAAMSSWLQGRGYKVRDGVEGDARLSTLRTVSGDGFFYINTHGGCATRTGRDGTGVELYSIWSSTPASIELDRVPEYKDDLDNLRLTYFTTTTGEVVIQDGKEIQVTENRYGITHNFVRKYWSFAPNSVVFINACNSANPAVASAGAFIKACHDNGAGVCLAWTKTVSNTGAYNAPRYFVDRLLGANAFMPERILQRPFAWDKVMEDMAVKGTDTDAYKGAKLVAIPNPNNKKSHILAPGIRQLKVDESADLLILLGDFGSTEGKVFIGGAEARIDKWEQDRIRCELKRPGTLGSCGPVFVRVGDRKSNIRQLTQWTTQLNYRFEDVDRPGLVLQGTGTLHHRADIGKLRDRPGEAPQNAVGYAIASADSALALSAGGSHPQPPDCVITWSGSMTYPGFPADSDPKGHCILAYFKVDTTTRKGALGLAFGSMVPDFTENACHGYVNQFAPPLTELNGEQSFERETGIGPIVVPLPALNVDFDTDFTLIGNTYSANGLTLRWSSATPQYPPTPSDVI